jgi:hypothetical protein
MSSTLGFIAPFEQLSSLAPRTMGFSKAILWLQVTSIVFEPVVRVGLLERPQQLL